MSEELAEPDTSQTPLELWVSDHPEVMPYITFTKDSSTKNDSPSRMFAKRRKNLHSKYITKIGTIYQEVKGNQSFVEKQLDNLTAKSIPIVQELFYDNPGDNLAVRKQVIMLLKYHTLSISIYTQIYGNNCDYMKMFKDVYDLIDSDIIDDFTICNLSDGFFKLHVTENEAMKRDKKKIQCLSAAIIRNRAYLKSLTKAQWTNDYPGFIIKMIDEAKTHMISDVPYFLPFDLEVSLSRCFFNFDSPYITTIDEVVDKILTLDSHEFITELLSFCSTLIPPQITSGYDQSIATMFIFRTLFNRCYEKHSDVFKPRDAPTLEIIAKVAELPAKYFTLPQEMLSSEITNQSIGELFRNDNFFMSASQFLSMSQFASTPIDALYYIHKCISMIIKGALINRMGPSSEASVADIKKMLCFDDLFSLLFGTLMADDQPNLFQVSWFVNNYSPKNSLSPAFEYALANIEALDTHCTKLNPEEIVEKGESTHNNNNEPPDPNDSNAI